MCGVVVLPMHRFLACHARQFAECFIISNILDYITFRYIIIAESIVNPTSDVVIVDGSTMITQEMQKNSKCIS